MCKCKNVEFGTFGCPNQNRTAVITCNSKLQEIDNCILDELQSLWKKGILTDASCCGHNKTFGSILVHKDHIKIMKSMGYVQGKRLDWFYPKSIPISNKLKD